ncbi:uncharacterized protein [Mytilus edulis]|uniref:uncharacterized protein n=1 Tax=Mytilus edulis TaxID=6550 RepID=UPI0039EEDE80
MKQICLFYVFSILLAQIYGNGNSTCNTEMFGGDFNAYMACKTQFALQSNWFPSPIAGLFSYLIWNGYDGFWENGCVLEPMVNFIEYANNTRYMNVVKASQRELYSLLEAYGPYPSFDDMGWYGLSYSRIYEVLGEQEFLQTAIDIFNWAWKTGWDHTYRCGGGFWFDNNFENKETITNTEFLQLAAKLYRLTKNNDFLVKMDQIYFYILRNKLINETTYLINDGATSKCKPNQSYGPTYLPGTMIGSLVEMYKISENKSHIDLAIKLANAAILNSTNITGIFTEYCDPHCNRDEILFKGIFVRNLRYLMDELDDADQREHYQNWLDFNVKAIIQFNMCDKDPISNCNITFQDGPPYFNVTGPVFSPDWNGPFTYGAPEPQTAAFDLFVASIKPETTCKGTFCSYDPSYPPPQTLTCGSHPCPSNEECCEYSPYTSYTCCTPDQKCNKQGICV